MKKIFNVIIIFLFLTLVGCSNEVKSNYTLSDDNVILTVGESSKINLYNNDEIVVDNITWMSSSSSVASVDNGLIKANSAGECVITVIYDDEALICNITVNAPLTYNLNVTNLELDTNDTFTLYLTNTVDVITAGIIWTSTNPMYASVEDGIVTAKSVGSVVISAIYNGEIYSCDVVVINAFKIILNTQLDDTSYETSSNEVTYKTKKLNNNTTLLLDYSVNKENPLNSDVVYFSSSNEKVATVNSAGLISTISNGITVISLISEELIKEESYVVEFILIVGDGSNDFFVNDSYEYNALYSWQGFNINLSGVGSSVNTNWIKSNLITIDATINLTLNKDNTFEEKSINLPSNGYNHNFDYNASESTITQAQAKYGNALFIENKNEYEGVIVNYTDAMYLITCNDNDTLLSDKVRSIYLDEFAYSPISIDTTKDLTVDLVDGSSISGNYEAKISATFNTVRLDLYDNNTYKYFTVDNLNNQYVIASGIFTKDNNNVVLKYYNDTKQEISLDIVNNQIIGSNINCGFSTNDVEMSLIEFSGVYVSNLYVEEMDAAFKFDITFNSDNTYTYFRYETTVNGSVVTQGIVNNGTYNISGGILILTYTENQIVKTMQFDIVSSSYIISLNELPTGYMSANMSFIKE